MWQVTDLFHGRELFRLSCAAILAHHHSYTGVERCYTGKMGAAPNASRLLLELSETSKHEEEILLRFM